MSEKMVAASEGVTDNVSDGATAKRTGRRTALTAGLTTAALFAVAKAAPAEAADGDTVLLGTLNSATSGTIVSADVGTGAALTVQNGGLFGTAIQAQSLAETGTAWGVYGSAIAPQGRGVFGEAGGQTGSGIGVRGISYAPSGRGSVASAPDTGTGVVGYVGDAEPTFRAGVGVHGASSLGAGVRGDSDTGTAVIAFTPSVSGVRTGVAIAAWGRVRLINCAGVATIAAGASSVVVTPGIDMSTASSVVATLQGNAGGSTTVKYAAVNTTANTFTVYLTAAATASVKVAWHVFG